MLPLPDKHDRRFVDTTTSDNVLLSEPKAGVRPLTLNGAAKLNAISADRVHALTDAPDAVLRDDDIPVVILRAVGRAFSVAADTSTHGI